MATLREYFDIDFNSILNVVNTFQLKSDSDIIECIGRVHLDFNSNTKYISCFLPECDNPVSLCFGILKSLDQILSTTDDVEVQSNLLGEKPMTNKDLLFSGRLFIYSESAIEKSLLEKLQGEAKAPKVDPIFCYRAAGWDRQFWEPILGVEFKKCTITHSILKGDKFCAWEYNLNE